MPMSDGHRAYPCRTAFWEKNKESLQTEYIHRSEFEQTFVSLTNELAAMRDERDEYQSKYHRALHRIPIADARSSDNKRLHNSNRELNWKLQRMKSESKKNRLQKEKHIERMKRDSISSRHCIKHLNRQNNGLVQRNSFLERQLEDMKMRVVANQARSKSVNCAHDSLRNHIGDLRKHDNKKKKWCENRIHFYQQELREKTSENERLKKELNEKEKGRSQTFADAKQSQNMNNAMKKSMDKLKNENEVLMEEVQMLRAFKRDHRKYTEKNSLYPLFTQLSQIVAELRSQHRIHRNKTDCILSDIRQYIDEATKESKIKQQTLENILRLGSPMKGGKKGTMVRENRDHTEYLSDIMRKLHQKVHKLFRINREDEMSDAWKRLSIKMGADSTLTSSTWNVSGVSDVPIGNVPFEEEEKQNGKKSRRLSKEDVNFLHDLHLFLGGDNGIEKVKKFIKEHPNEDMVINI